ncbi:hypothetical protein [Mesobacillus foraminis]|uniref:hypothetical protein n=1 Tax=Mesobacillus foraminis TaxID=279826 RepID=UPI0010443FAE|nr:hypothetical protein [Mesobacillus foraminis]
MFINLFQQRIASISHILLENKFLGKREARYSSQYIGTGFGSREYAGVLLLPLQQHHPFKTRTSSRCKF